MSVYPFGDVLRQLRLRIPGLTQARVAELAGYDPAVITRMARGKQDLTGPHARERVLHVIQALDEAGALRGLDDANALLVAANLPPLIKARDLEAELIQRITLHDGVRKAAHVGGASAKTSTHAVRRTAFIQQIEVARSKLGRANYANAWAAGQMLTLREARAWLAALHTQMSS